jgi:hypothetical protein
LKPRWLHEETRVKEICDAIVRHKEAKCPIWAEWLDELRDLTGARDEPICKKPNG